MEFLILRILFIYCSFMKFLFMGFLLIPNLLHAQTTGTVKASITDSLTGEPMPFTQLSFIDSLGIVKATAETDLDGEFIVPNLSKGTYKLILKAYGYCTDTLEGLKIMPGPRLIHITMQVEPPDGCARFVIKEKDIIYKMPEMEKGYKGDYVDKLSRRDKRRLKRIERKSTALPPHK